MFNMPIRHLSRDMQVWSCKMKKQSFRVIFIIICDNWLSQLFLALIIKNLNYRLKPHFLEYFLLRLIFAGV